MVNDFLDFVTYSNKRQKFRRIQNFRDYSLFTSTKGLDWQYEKEVRIIVNNDDKRIVARDGCYYTSAYNRYLTGIILGPRTKRSICYLYRFLATVEEDPMWHHALKGKHRLRIDKVDIDEHTYNIGAKVLLPEGVALEQIPFTDSIYLGTKGIDEVQIIPS